MTSVKVGSLRRLGLSPTLRRLDTARVRTLTTSEAQRDRSSFFQSLREQVLADANGLCQCAECKALGRLRFATEVDHIVPLWEGGHATDRANLQAINVECHKAKSAAEAARRLGSAPA